MKVNEYKISFHEKGKLIGVIYVASPDSVVAESIGRKIAGKNVSVSVS